MISIVSGFLLTTYSLIGFKYIYDEIMNRQEKLIWDVTKYQEKVDWDITKYNHNPSSFEKLKVIEEAEKIINGRENK